MPPNDLHITYEDAFCALRQERDRWANMAMEQLQYIRQLEEEINQLKRERMKEESVSMPAENDYITLVQWLAAEKTRGNDYYAEAGYNRSRMCRELRKRLGWTPDQNSLRKAQNK